jgi:hypothetical protein
MEATMHNPYPQLTADERLHWLVDAPLPTVRFTDTAAARLAYEPKCASCLVPCYVCRYLLVLTSTQRTRATADLSAVYNHVCHHCTQGHLVDGITLGDEAIVTLYRLTGASINQTGSVEATMSKCDCSSFPLQFGNQQWEVTLVCQMHPRVQVVEPRQAWIDAQGKDARLAWLLGDSSGHNPVIFGAADFVLRRVVINAEAPAGRRLEILFHELGHVASHIVGLAAADEPNAEAMATIIATIAAHSFRDLLTHLQVRS